MSNSYLSSWFNNQLVNGQGSLARLKVESVNTSDSAFNEGRAYRLDYVVDIPEGSGPLVLKFQIAAPIDLTFSELSLIQGGVHYQVYTESQVTETSPFSAQVNRIFPRNARLPANPEVQVMGGGAVSIGANEEPNTNLFVKTANFNFSRENALADESQRRGFPPVNVYIVMDELSSNSTDTLGTLKIEYEVLA